MTRAEDDRELTNYRKRRFNTESTTVQAPKVVTITSGGLAMKQIPLDPVHPLTLESRPISFPGSSILPPFSFRVGV